MISGGGKLISRLGDHGRWKSLEVGGVGGGSMRKEREHGEKKAKSGAEIEMETKQNRET